MAKQIYNTRGWSLEQLKEILMSKKGNATTHYRNRMSRLKKDMEYLERQIIQNNQEIEYLEKYIKKKEGVKNGKIS